MSTSSSGKSAIFAVLRALRSSASVLMRAPSIALSNSTVRGKATAGGQGTTAGVRPGSAQPEPEPTGQKWALPSRARASPLCTMAAVLARMRPLLARLPAKIDEQASRLTPYLLLALWPVAYGIALGAAGFAWTHPSLRPFLELNKAPESESLGMLGWTAGGLAVVLAIHVGAMAHLPRPRASALPALLARLRRRLRFTLALPIALALAGPGIEAEGASTVLALAALAAMAIAATAYGWTEGPSPETTPPANPVAGAAGLVGLVGLVAAFIAVLGRLTITNFKALRPHTIDLGLYDNILWHTAHGDLLGGSFLKGGHHNSAHFDPLLIALAPIYALRPHADTLLVLQIVWVSSTLVPLYLLARAKLGSPLYGLGFAAMYAHTRRSDPALSAEALWVLKSLDQLHHMQAQTSRQSAGTIGPDRLGSLGGTAVEVDRLAGVNKEFRGSRANGYFRIKYISSGPASRKGSNERDHRVAKFSPRSMPPSLPRVGIKRT